VTNIENKGVKKVYDSISIEYNDGLKRYLVLRRII